MGRYAGSLIIGSLPTETQPAYLPSQGASDLHWLSWFFPGPLTSCSAQLRSEVDRRGSSYTCLPQKIASFFPNSPCTRASWGLKATPGFSSAYCRLHITMAFSFPVHTRSIIYNPVTARASLLSKHDECWQVINYIRL